MAKQVPDAIIDTMLAVPGDLGTQIVITSGEPANFAAVAGLTLATAVFSGAKTQANGDVSGRKLTYPAQTTISITTTGSATHVCMTNGTDTLALVTTCATQSLTSGGTVDTSAFDHEIPDPA